MGTAARVLPLCLSPPRLCHSPTTPAHQHRPSDAVAILPAAAHDLPRPPPHPRSHLLLHLTTMPRLRARAAPLTASSAPTASSTRPRRGTANQSPASAAAAAAAAVIQRSSPEETRQSIHLTVKSSPGKLRQATSGAVPKPGVSRQNIVAGKRASRSSRIVREVDSEDDDDEDDEEAEEVDAMDVDDDEDEEDDVDAEGDEDEDMDAEGDEDDDAEDSTPAPRIVVSTKQSIPVKPIINISKPQDSVEAKEMAMDDDDDDDDLSDPDSDLDEEDAEGEDEDAEGDEDDDMADQNGDLDEEMDSDEDLSRGQTPDVSKMTKRQRALVEEGSDGGLMALSNEAQKKKHLTAEENAMRRAEMARRRKNLSEKRNEEEKMDTINRLLKKQPPKRGRRALDTSGSGQEDGDEPERANPLFVRYVQNAKGTQMGVPDEWLQAPVGSFFAGDLAPKNSRPFAGRMVEEVS
ncbi:PAPA-1-like conserved region-domain-containing protein [Paraphoma chrysanthemicola]|nr:PAPA-1-like conserved region-domain-containing protein [Paraphoma chrysanthemicola]